MRYRRMSGSRRERGRHDGNPLRAGEYRRFRCATVSLISPTQISCRHRDPPSRGERMAPSQPDRRGYVEVGLESATGITIHMMR